MTCLGEKAHVEEMLREYQGMTVDDDLATVTLLTDETDLLGSSTSASSQKETKIARAPITYRSPSLSGCSAGIRSKTAKRF